MLKSVEKAYLGTEMSQLGDHASFLRRGHVSFPRRAVSNAFSRLFSPRPVYDPRKQPLLVQEANAEALQEKPAAFQEHFLALDEEQLEKIVGGTWPGCCNKPRTSSPPPTRPTETTGTTGTTSTPSGQPSLVRSGTSPRVLTNDQVARLRAIHI